MKLLTKSQAEHFLSVKLGLPDWKAQVEYSKLKFFRTLYRQYRSVVYYENVTWGARSLEELLPPSEEEVVQLLLETPGGACLQLNYFFQLLLTHLGYGVKAVSADQKTCPFRHNNHITLIVRFTKAELTSDPEASSLDIAGDDGDVQFLVEVGMPWPMPDPIDIRKLPHYTKLCKDFTICYEHSPDESAGTILRSFIGGHPTKGPFESKDFKYTDLTIVASDPQTFEDFLGTMTKIFTDHTRGIFLNTCFLFRFLALQDSDSYSYVLCLGRQICVVSSTKSSRSVQGYETYMDMLPDLLRHFPGISPEALTRALRNYDERRSLGFSSL